MGLQVPDCDWFRGLLKEGGAIDQRFVGICAIELRRQDFTEAPNVRILRRGDEVEIECGEFVDVVSHYFLIIKHLWRNEAAAEFSLDQFGRGGPYSIASPPRARAAEQILAINHNTLNRLPRACTRLLRLLRFCCDISPFGSTRASSSLDISSHFASSRNNRAAPRLTRQGDS
jgi:hypothetical protein